MGLIGFVFSMVAKAAVFAVVAAAVVLMAAVWLVSDRVTPWDPPVATTVPG